MFVILLYLAIIALLVVSMWKIFTKAGKPGYEALIGGHNVVVLLELVGKPTWWFFLFMIPFANFIFLIWLLNLISLSYGKSTGFTVGLVLLPFIFIPILGLGSAKYQGPVSKEAQLKNSVENNTAE